MKIGQKVIARPRLSEWTKDVGGKINGKIGTVVEIAEKPMSGNRKFLIKFDDLPEKMDCGWRLGRSWWMAIDEIKPI